MALVPDRFLTGKNVPGMSDFISDIGLGDFPSTVPVSSGGYTYSSGIDLGNYDNVIFTARIIPGSGSYINATVEWSPDDSTWCKQTILDYTIDGGQGVVQIRPQVFSVADIYTVPIQRLERYVRFGVEASGVEDGDVGIGARAVRTQF